MYLTERVKDSRDKCTIVHYVLKQTNNLNGVGGKGYPIIQEWRTNERIDEGVSGGLAMKRGWRGIGLPRDSM